MKIIEIKKIIYKKSFIFTVLALLLIGGVFYWFAYRPAKIRHDCSWVRVVDPAKPAEPAITQEDVKNSQLEYDKCIVNEAKPEDYQGGRKFFFSAFPCETKLEKERPAIPAKPERVWYRKEADKDEYNFCIHEKGL